MTEMPVIRFSVERRRDLRNLGVTDDQIAEVEAVLPSCTALIESAPRLQDTRTELSELITALRCLQRLIRAPTKAAREALNRWQMAAYDRSHSLGSNPEFAQMLDLDTLIEAARGAKKALGNKQRRSHAATAEPIRRIADALALGRSKGHAPELRQPQRYRMRSRVFAEVVQYAYEAMGYAKDYVPERALRTYRDWRKKDAAKQRTERDTIT
jgi:hypothetical protein